MFPFILLFSSVLFLTFDFIYIRIVKPYFSDQIVQVQSSPLKPNYLGIAFCYLFLLTGLHYFIIRPRKSVSDAFLLGIVIYGVYETTNVALFTNWSWLTVFVDTLWGGILFGATTWVSNEVFR